MTLFKNNFILCKIWGFHGGDYEERHVLGCYVLWLLYETTVLTRVTRRNLQEDAILHSHRRENLKSYMKNLVNGDIKLSNVNWLASCFQAHVSLELFSAPQDVGDTYTKNVRWLQRTTSQKILFFSKRNACWRYQFVLPLCVKTWSSERIINWNLLRMPSSEMVSYVALGGPTFRRNVASPS
jgi:hypothetical protein